MTRLVAIDIGGTHARFALAQIAPDNAIALEDVQTLHSHDFPSLESAWNEFAARVGGALPPAAAIAVAATVNADEIRLTNNPWVIRRSELMQALGVERVTLVNDFAAVAHAVARLDERDFQYLAGPDKAIGSEGTISVLGPGTGLGVAHLWRGEGGTYRVQATEGGHVDFAPLDAIEDAILAKLRTKYSRVSAERVASGPAIVDIYETLADLEGRRVAKSDDVTIWSQGMSGNDDLAAVAIDRFCLSLGSIAGDIALAQGGFSGVVIAGGLGYRLRDVLPKSGFAERFCAKGRFAPLMASIPVRLVIHPQPGLLGAAAAFAFEHL